MAYLFFMAGTQLPIPPGTFTHEIGSRNVTYDLVSGEQITILKGAELRKYSFKIVLPATRVPFAAYRDNVFVEPIVYLELFKFLSDNKSPFQLDIYREMPDGRQTWYTNQTVSLEDYTVTESAENVNDVEVSINLREYQYRSTKVVKINDDGVTYEVIRENTKTPARVINSRVGDNLYIIAMREMGDCSDEAIQYLYMINYETIMLLVDAFDLESAPTYTITEGTQIKLYDAQYGTLAEYKAKVSGE